MPPPNSAVFPIIPLSPGAGSPAVGAGGETLRLGGVIIGRRGEWWQVGQQAVDQMGIPIGKYWLLGGSRACIFCEIERARPAGNDLPLIILIVPAHLPTFWNWWGLSFRSCHLIEHTMATPRFLDTTASNHRTEFKGSANTFRLSSCSLARRGPSSGRDSRYGRQFGNPKSSSYAL
jgi:hypothetical protein